MDNESNELLAAAEIRKVAVQIREEAFEYWLAKTGKNARCLKAVEWKATEAIDKFLPQAFEQLREIAALRRATAPD